jgi:hypothetical protein
VAGVGAGVAQSGGEGRAYFSDYGPWVDVYAPGERLVKAWTQRTWSAIVG